MTDIVIECMYCEKLARDCITVSNSDVSRSDKPSYCSDPVSSIDTSRYGYCPKFPKRIRWSSKATGWSVYNDQCFKHILKLVNYYNAQMYYVNNYVYFYINDIVFNDYSIHTRDLNNFYHTGEILLNGNSFEEIYNYLDDNGYGQNIKLKFVD